MDIAVILHQAPDTEAKIDPDTSNPGRIMEDGVKFILNPYDEFAVEEALKITEARGGEVIGVCIGPERAESAIRTAMAMGIHRVVWIKDTAAVQGCILFQGRVLAAAVKSLPVQLVLCGREWIDVQEDSLAGIIGEFLNWPHIMNASKVNIETNRITVIREVDGASLEFEAPLPSVVSCQKDLNEPRYPTLIAIKRAKMKEIKVLGLGDLGIAPEEPKVRWIQMDAPPPRQAGRIIKGEPEEVGSQAVRFISDQAKVL